MSFAMMIEKSIPPGSMDAVTGDVKDILKTRFNGVCVYFTKDTRPYMLN